MIETRRFSSSAKNFVTRNVNAIAIFRVQKSKHAFASHPISHVLLAKILFLYTDLSSSTCYLFVYIVLYEQHQVWTCMEIFTKQNSYIQHMYILDKIKKFFY